MSNSIVPIGDRAASLKPSGIRKFFDLLDERKDAISLGVGQPDFITPKRIREAGIAALERGETKYTSNSGILSLREECAAYMKRRFSLDYNPKGEILVTVGGSEAIDLCIRAILNFGDEVIIHQPTFVCYPPLVTMAGGVPVIVETFEEDGFKLRPEKLPITPRTKALFLAYPCNPTGGIMEKADIEAIAKIAIANNLFVISDEIYAEHTYDGKHVSIASLPGMKERTLVVGGLSKSHSMTGWRMGFAYGPAELIQKMTIIHQYGLMCAPTVSQFAATVALRDCDDDVVSMRDEFDNRRRLMLDGFASLGLPCFEAKGAFYLFPCIKGTGLSSEEFCMELLEKQDVACVPGSAFGDCGEGFIRVCYAASEDNLKESLKRIGLFLETVNKGNL